MIRPTGVKALEGNRLWLEYSDGSAGEVDLFHIAGTGVFTAWNDPGCFEKVHVAPHGAIAWDDALELCPDALYLALSGKSVEEAMPGVRALTENA